MVDFTYITSLLCEINVNNNWMFSNCWVLEQCKLLIRFILKLKLNINWVITKFDIENLIVMTHIQLTCPRLLTNCWPTHSTSLGSYWLLHFFCEEISSNDEMLTHAFTYNFMFLSHCLHFHTFKNMNTLTRSLYRHTCCLIPLC